MTKTWTFGMAEVLPARDFAHSVHKGNLQLVTKLSSYG